jgi:hypothetical protein
MPTAGYIKKEGKSLFCGCEQGEKFGMVVRRMEDRLSIVAACDHVVQTAFDLDPGLSSHVRDCTFTMVFCENLRNYAGLTPSFLNGKASDRQI